MDLPIGSKAVRQTRQTRQTAFARQWVCRDQRGWAVNNIYRMNEQTMLLTFTNRRDKKNCQRFIKAVKQVEKYNSKQRTRALFLNINEHGIRLAPSLTDIHADPFESSCFAFVHRQHYEALDPDIGIYQINASLLLSLFSKFESRVAHIELKIPRNAIKLKLSFVVENNRMEVETRCRAQVPCVFRGVDWPQPVEHVRDGESLVHVAKLSEEFMRGLTLEETNENVWLVFEPECFFFRIINGTGLIVRESKMPLLNNCNYNFNFLKSKFVGRMIVYIPGGPKFIHRLRELAKKKGEAQLVIKVLKDSGEQTSFRRTFLVMMMQTDYGIIQHVSLCYLCEYMVQAVEHCRQTRDLVRRREQDREINLLKKEESGPLVEMKRVVINSVFGEVGVEKRQAEDAYRERRIGKLEEGEETITRKFQSKY